jgi:hypothetical protein
LFLAVRESFKLIHVQPKPKVLGMKESSETNLQAILTKMRIKN